MKKILLGMGAIASVVAPITAVVACNNSDSIDYGKHMQNVLEAFKDSTKSTDVKTDVTKLVSRFEKIQTMKGDEKTKAEESFYKEIFPKIAQINFGTIINHVAYSTMIADFHSLTDMLSSIETEVKALDLNAAKEFGIKTQADLDNLVKFATQLNGVQQSTDPNDDKGVIIGDKLNADAKQIFEALYDTKVSDMSVVWKKLSDDYDNAIKNDDTKKEFILEVGRTLSNLDGPHSGDPSNQFVSTTDDAKMTKWKEIFTLIKTIAGSFDNDESAQRYGFSSWEEALQAKNYAGKMEAVTKGADATGDATRVTI